MERSCGACGQTASSTARFCAACGADLVADRCPCGEALPPAARYCPACGSPSRDTRAPPPGPAEAERRTVTVLFADAVGSTSFTEQSGDEAAYRLVKECVALMTEAIERHGGTITHFRGDGVMALFGAPHALEASAVHAVTAALELRDALADHGARSGAGWDFRIGLSTGPVVVGRVGDEVLLDYTAIGDTANVAARMEQAADAGTVFVSGATWRAVRQYVECRPLGELEVKGKERAVAAYEVVRRRPIRTRLEAAVERGLGPFVGRSRELDLLLDHVDDLGSGRGNVVEITGEPGIGKSRLLLELRRRLPEAVVWREGHCSAGASEVPYLPIADLLRNAFGVEEHDDPAAVAARVDTAAAEWSQEARRVVPYLKYVLDVEPGDASVIEADARTRRAAIVDALRISLADAARRQPRVLVFEDVHWADPASCEAIASLAETAGTEAVLLITTSRTGYESPFGDRSIHSRLGLDSLSDGAAAELAASTLDTDEVPADIASLVTEKAEGNPLFVEELTVTLVETGLVTRNHGDWQLTRPAEDIDVPGTVQEVILARIDRLERGARDALQLAAVIGREFTVRLLDRLAGLPDGLDETLEELKALELIRQKAWFPELAYLFKHALTHEVTYATLLEERRRSLHRLVAQAIEDVYADRLAEHVETLAHHWLVAKEWDKALDYAEQAGDSAAATFSNESAIAFYDQAVGLASQLGRHDRAATIAFRLGDVHLGVGDLRAAHDAFDRMAVAARAAGDDVSLGWALTMRAEADFYSHDFEGGEQTALEVLDMPRLAEHQRLYVAALLQIMRVVFCRHEEAAALEPTVARLLPAAQGDARTLATVSANMAMAARWRGAIDRCVELASIDVPVGADLIMRQAILWVRGLGLGERGDYDGAFAALAEAVRRSETTGEAMFRARAYNSIGWLRADLGDHQGAVAMNERCLSFLGEVDIPDEEVMSNARLNLADTYLSVGRLDHAAEHVAYVEELVQGKALRDTWALWRYGQHLLLTASSVLLARAEPGAVGSRIDDCEALAAESSSRKYQGKAARVRGRLALVRGEPDEAAEHAGRALSIAAEVGHPPERWRALALLADIAAARGDADAAEEHRRAADRLLADVQVRLVDRGARCWGGPVASGAGDAAPLAEAGGEDVDHALAGLGRRGARPLEADAGGEEGRAGHGEPGPRGDAGGPRQGLGDGEHGQHAVPSSRGALRRPHPPAATASTPTAPATTAWPPPPPSSRSSRAVPASRPTAGASVTHELPPAHQPRASSSAATGAT